MGRWKAEQGKGREKRKIRRKKSKKKEDADAWKGKKVAKHCVFPMICGSGGSKSRLAKAAGAEPAGQIRDEKLHAVVARSTFASQNVQNTWCSEHFWKFRCRKSAHRCGTKHISKSKVQKNDGYGALLDVQMCFRVAGAKNCAPEQKWAKSEGFAAFPKTLAGVGHLKRIFKDAFRVAGAVQKTCSSEMLGGQGADLEHQIFRFAEMILRDRCGTSYDLASIFRGRRNTLRRWSGKIAKRIGTSLSALHSTFHFWRKSRRILRFWWLALRKMRKSRRIASFRMLSSSKNEDVSQNCCVLDVLMFKHYGSLAKFLRFWSCR